VRARTSRASSPTIALTLGDPRGIGPEVTTGAAVLFLEEHPEASILLVGAEESAPMDLDFHAVGTFDGSEQSAGRVSARAIEEATRLALGREVVAVVTGPVSKPALRAAGWNLP